jgi:tetratricopeptide (TPR) repeat protein
MKHNWGNYSFGLQRINTMPFVYNGIGTWYYGKRRVHRVKGVCEFCKSFGELQSYDTTHYFVVFFIPLLPLGSKRILENCPYCQKHRVIGLKDWEKNKSEGFASVMDKLRQNPDDKETIQQALGLATVYQDETSFDKLAPVLAGHRTDDQDIQLQLGAAYEYFSRWEDAEEAYQRALAIEDTEESHERLAVCLLKQRRSEEAAPHIQHVFESKNPEKAWLVYWLIEGLMAEGMYDEALKLIDTRDDMYPELVKEKSYKTQRKQAEKLAKSGKAYRSNILSESGKTGYHEGSNMGLKWPLIIGPAIAAILLAIYLYVAYDRGANRKVHLVNGLTRPYAVSVNGETHQLNPGSPKLIEVPEGQLAIDWKENPEGPESVEIKTNFWGRPFNRPIFVVNPDHMALLEYEETVYAETRPFVDDKPFEVKAGRLLHRFDGADYIFEPFPQTIQVKKGSTIMKSRVGVVPIRDTSERLMELSGRMTPAELEKYAKRLVTLNPSDEMALGWLVAKQSPEEAIAFLKPGLAVRPPRVMWHRIYQDLMEVSQPKADLLGEYKKLLQETKNSPDALYLLGRIENGPAREKLFRQAASANPPSVYAHLGLGNWYKVRGEYNEALDWTQKAASLEPSSLSIQENLNDSLLAAGKYRDLLQATQRDAMTVGSHIRVLHARLTAHMALGERGAAEGEINQIMAQMFQGHQSPASLPIRKGFDAMLTLIEGNREKYLAATQGTPGNDATTQFVKGDYRKAIDEFGKNPPPKGNKNDWESEASWRGLFYIAAMKAQDKKTADEQMEQLTQVLSRGDTDGRHAREILLGKVPFTYDDALQAAIQPEFKRVLMAVYAYKFPKDSKSLLELSRKLDYNRDVISLSLKVTQQAANLKQ